MNYDYQNLAVNGIGIVISGVTLGLGFIVGLFALIQWKKNIALKRADTVKMLMLKLRAGKRIKILM